MRLAEAAARQQRLGDEMRPVALGEQARSVLHVLLRERDDLHSALHSQKSPKTLRVSSRTLAQSSAKSPDSLYAMPSETDDRHGQVFIAPWPDGGFGAYWDNLTPPFPIEEPPPFGDVEDAIAWGRTRARKVLVRLGDDSTTMYSAGQERLAWTSDSPEDLLPEWPPDEQPRFG